jgi:HK97 gp10 family phage protein
MVRFVNRAGKFMSQLNANQTDALNKVGDFCVEKMQYYCAKRTGNLMRACKFQIVRNELALINDVVNPKGVPYAIFNELGTRKWAGQPFMKPAVYNHLSEIHQIMGNAFRRGMS